MDTLLEKDKANLILEHSADDALLQNYITAAVSYAESYQHIQEGYYTENAMPATTEQAVIMLASHFYESRDCLLYTSIPSNLYMRICLEGYDTFCFDKNVLVDAYDKCREVCGYEG